MSISTEKGRIVVITGASRGIGAACAQVFRENGDTVFVLSRTPPKDQALQHIPADLSDDEQARTAIHAVLEQTAREVAYRGGFRQVDDEALREKVARRWSELNGVEITPEMINCVGCRIEGVKTPYCASICPIRKCAMGRGMETCGDCSEMEACEKLGAILENNADAYRDLKE